METKNAIIKKATIDIQDRGLLTIWLELDYGGSCQGFGGYALYLPQSFKHHDREAPYTGHFIYRVLEIAGVGQWEQLAGKTIRVQAEQSKIHAIGHIVKDDWFNPATDFENIEKTTQITSQP
jgi:hypothetical protein